MDSKRLITTTSTPGSITISTDGFHFSTLGPAKDLTAKDITAELSSVGFLNIDSKSRYSTNVEIVDQNHDVKEKVKTSVSVFNHDVMPDKVIYNDDTTILIKDNDKYVVKCTEGDKFDPVFGFLYGYFLMNNRMSKTQASKFFKHLEKCVNDDCEIPKVKEVEKVLDNKSLTLDEYEKMMREVLEDFIV